MHEVRKRSTYRRKCFPFGYRVSDGQDLGLLFERIRVGEWFLLKPIIQAFTLKFCQNLTVKWLDCILAS